MLHLHAENHISECRQSCYVRDLPAGTSGKAARTLPTGCHEQEPAQRGPTPGEGLHGSCCLQGSCSTPSTPPCSSPEMLQAPSGSSHFVSKAFPMGRGSRTVRYACHLDIALHGVSIQLRKAAGPWLLAAGLAGWLPAGELAGSSTGLAHPWDQGHGSCWQPSPKPSAKQRRQSAGWPLTLVLRSLLVP